MTTKHPVERAKELSGTGVPAPFVVDSFWAVEASELKSVERQIHNELNGFRYSQNREFFKIPAEKAKREIEHFFVKKNHAKKRLRTKESKLAEAHKRAQKTFMSINSMNESFVEKASTFVSGLNNHLDLLSGHISKVLPEKHAVETIFNSGSAPIEGTPIKHSKWDIICELNDSFAYRNPGHNVIRHPVLVPDLTMYIFVFSDVRVARRRVGFGETLAGLAMGKRTIIEERKRMGYVCITYDIHSGCLLTDMRQDATIINQNTTIFPEYLSQLLTDAQLFELANQWNAIFKPVHKLRKEIEDGLLCPFCLKHHLRLHKERNRWSQLRCPSTSCNVNQKILPSV